MSELLLARDAPAGRLRALALAHAPRYGLRLALVVGLYDGTARLGFALSFAGPVAAIVWLPAGVGIASLYLGGPALWPAVLAGDLLANDYSALPWPAALGQTAGNLAEVLLAALLLRRLVRRGSPLDTVRGVGWMLVAIAAGTAVSATVGSLSLRSQNVVATNALWDVWRTWWLGDACGALVVVSLAVAWLRGEHGVGWTRARVLEAALVLGAVVSTSEVAQRSDRPLSYVVFPILMWAALRFGQRGATVAVALAVFLAIWNTVHYAGPFHFHSITRMTLSVQLYIAVAAITTFCLAAVASERAVFAEGLSRSRARLVEAADGERRRLERNLHDGAQHRLTALAYHLREAAERVLASPADAPVLFEEAETEVELAIDELRELAHGIHPAVLTDLGLANALRSIAARSTVPIELVELPGRRLDATAEATAYYVVAEAVTNAQRYAHASLIRIRVSAARGLLRVEIVDDGVGGARMTDGSGGLQGMCDRVEALGGIFSLGSSPRGTRIGAAIPAAYAA